MNKKKTYSIISIACYAVILIICLLVIFNYGRIWDYFDADLDGLSMTVSFLLGWPFSMICALFSVVLIVCRSIILAKSDSKANVKILLPDILFFMFCALLTIFLMDVPVIETKGEIFILCCACCLALPSFAPVAFIIISVLTLMPTLMFLLVVFDLAIIFSPNNKLIDKNKDEISNGQGTESVETLIMKKSNRLFKLSIAGNAVILTVCLLVLLAYMMLIGTRTDNRSFMLSLLLGVPLSIICAQLSAALIVLKTIFLTKGNNKFNLIILLLDIALYLLCGLCTILLMDNPIIDGLTGLGIITFALYFAVPYFGPLFIIVLAIVTLLFSFTLLSTVFDIKIIVSTKNNPIDKNRDDICNGQGTESAETSYSS